MKKLILITICLLSFSSFSQSRSPAVENEIIIQTEDGTQTKQFLEKANAISQGSPMNVFTLFALFSMISAPFGIYLVIEKQNANRRQSELQENVILMSEYQKKKSGFQSDKTDDDDDQGQAA